MGVIKSVQGVVAAVLAATAVLSIGAPSASAEAGGYCGAPVNQYFGAYEHKHCGPFYSIEYIAMWSTSSTGVGTNSNVCVRGEYPSAEAAIPGYDWYCNSSGANMFFSCCVSARGAYLNNEPYAHYGMMEYYWWT